MKKRRKGIVLVAGALGVATAFSTGSASNVLNPVMLTKAAEGDLEAEGKCGTDATYTFKDGLLSIRGTGAIDDNAFESQEDIQMVVIEDGITVIGESAFSGCSSLESVSLPGSVKEIGNYTFANTGLTELILPETVEKLGWNILQENEGVKELLIPKTVTYMGGANETLGGSAIERVVFEEGTTKVLDHACGGAEKLTEVVIPEGVTEIGNYAFTKTAISELEFPTTLTSIGWSVLDNNANLKELIVPKSVTYMGGVNDALSGSGVEKVTFESGIQKIPDSACAGAAKLSEVVIPESVKSIGDNAFGQTGLTTITIPESVKEIGNYAFRQTGITELKLPSKVERIGWNILDKNTGVKELFIPNTVTYMGGANQALGGSGVEKVTFEEGMKKIPENACSGAVKLSKVEIPESVKEIGNYAFAQTALTELKLPSKIEKIGWNILDKNTGVKELFIPNTVTYLGGANQALGGSGVEKVTFENGMKKIPENACSGASKLTEVVIPEGVTEIGNYAFAQTALTELKMPSKIEKIGWNILDKNTSVKELFIPKTVTYMGGANEALEGSGVETITFEDGMLTIPENACAKATQLKKVYIPVSVESFGEVEDYKDSSDLTFYCYEDSDAAHFALKNDIAYHYVGKAVNTKITLKNITKKSSTKTQKFTLKPSSNNRLGVYRFTSNRTGVKVDANGNVTISPNFSGIATITVQQTAAVQYKKGTTTVKISVSPSATKLSKLTNTKGRKMKVSWTKNKYASGYQLQYSTNSKFKGAKSKKIAGSKASSTTLSSLKQKKTYYVRIRTYKKDEAGTLYSTWSSAKKVKITK